MLIQEGAAISNQFFSGKLAFADSAFIYGLSGTAALYSAKFVESSTEHIRKGKLKLQSSFQHQADLKDRWEAVSAEETFTSWTGNFMGGSVVPSTMSATFRGLRVLADAAMVGAYATVLGQAAASGEGGSIGSVAADAVADIGMVAIMKLLAPHSGSPDLAPGKAEMRAATTEVSAETEWTLQAPVGAYEVDAHEKFECEVVGNKLEMTPEEVRVEAPAGVLELTSGASSQTLDEAVFQMDCAATMSLLSPEIVFE
jgi:hypothetical protein